MSAIRLIVGLGNPGHEYQGTRHNVGFWFIDLLAKKYNVSLSLESKFFGFVGKFKYLDEEIYLLKPQTYMNLSGKSVLALANFYKILPNQILVAHDELDFKPGIIKFKLGGGAAGHNGLKDVKKILGDNYWRLRIGIGHPGDSNKVAGFVLNKPKLDERIEIERSLDKSLLVLDDFLTGNVNKAIKELHTQ